MCIRDSPRFITKAFSVIGVCAKNFVAFALALVSADNLEEERERISREIHDGPLQDVTALVQRLRLLALDVSDEQTINNLVSRNRLSTSSSFPKR